MREKVIYTYRCEICNQVFSSTDEGAAQEQCRLCVAQGTLVKHAFKVGDAVSAFVGYGQVDADAMYIKALVLELRFEQKTHKPQYLIKGKSYLWEDKRLIIYAESAYRWVNGREPQKTFVGSGSFNLTEAK